MRERSSAQNAGRPVRPRRSVRSHTSWKNEASASWWSSVHPVGAGLGQGAVDDGLVEQVERGVVRGSPVAGGDADLVAGFLDRLDVEQVVVEVGVRARRPRFEATR